MPVLSNLLGRPKKGSLLLGQATELRLNAQSNCRFSLSQEWNFKPISLDLPSDIICIKPLAPLREGDLT